MNSPISVTLALTAQAPSMLKTSRSLTASLFPIKSKMQEITTVRSHTAVCLPIFKDPVLTFSPSIRILLYILGYRSRSGTRAPSFIP